MHGSIFAFLRTRSCLDGTIKDRVGVKIAFSGIAAKGNILLVNGRTLWQEPRLDFRDFDPIVCAGLDYSLIPTFNYPDIISGYSIPDDQRRYEASIGAVSWFWSETKCGFVANTHSIIGVPPNGNENFDTDQRGFDQLREVFRIENVVFVVSNTMHLPHGVRYETESRFNVKLVLTNKVVGRELRASAGETSNSHPMLHIESENLACALGCEQPHAHLNAAVSDWNHTHEYSPSSKDSASSSSNYFTRYICKSSSDSLSEREGSTLPQNSECAVSRIHGVGAIAEYAGGYQGTANSPLGSEVYNFDESSSTRLYQDSNSGTDGKSIIRLKSPVNNPCCKRGFDSGQNYSNKLVQKIQREGECHEENQEHVKATLACGNHFCGAIKPRFNHSLKCTQQ